MSQPLPDAFTQAHVDGLWGFTVTPNPDADPSQGPTQAWAGFFRSVGTNVPANVNRTIRLRAQIRSLGHR